MTYNVKHRVSNLTKSVYIKIIKIDTSEYYLFKTFNLFIKKIIFFKILKKIKSLVYKLKF